MPAILADSKRRVKVYMLSKHRQWDDKGTGYIETEEVVYNKKIKESSKICKKTKDENVHTKSDSKTSVEEDIKTDSVNIEKNDDKTEVQSNEDTISESKDSKTESAEMLDVENDYEPTSKPEKTNNSSQNSSDDEIFEDALTTQPTTGSTTTDDVKSEEVIEKTKPISDEEEETPSTNKSTEATEVEKDDLPVTANDAMEETEESDPQSTIKITVTSEDEPYKVLLESYVFFDVAYHKQQDTLIVWTDPGDIDLALSFEERSACDQVWEHICGIQGKDPKCEVTIEVEGDPYTSGGANDSNVNQYYHNDEFDDDDYHVMKYDPSTLPVPDFSNLSSTRGIFTALCTRNKVFSYNKTKQEHLVTKVKEKEYIKRLIKLFHEAESSNNLQALFDLNSIIRSIFNLNMIQIYEILFAPDILLDIIGMLEYAEPAQVLPSGYATATIDTIDRPKHRQFITDKVKFHQVLDIKNEELLSKIHQTFRVQYIQDCVLPPPSLFEDNQLTTMSTWIFFNKVDIVNQIIEDRQIILEVVAKAKDAKTTNATKIELGGFMKELCQYAQTLQHVERDSFYQVLASNSILDVIEIMLACSGKDSNKVQSLGGEVLAYLIDWNPAFVRRYCLDVATKNKSSLPGIPITTPSSSPPHILKEHDLIKNSSCNQQSTIKPMLLSNSRERKFSSSSSTSNSTVYSKPRPNIITLLIMQMINDTDNAQGGAVQLAALLRQLLDTDALTSSRAEIAEFMNFFYANCMKSLLDPIFQATSSSRHRAKHPNETTSHLPFPSTRNITPRLLKRIQVMSWHRANMINIILDILIFCVEHHILEARQYITRGDILPRIAVLARSRHLFLACTVVRLFRKMLGRADLQYSRKIIDQFDLEPIFLVLTDTGGRYNILQSAVLEMLDYITTNSMRDVGMHVYDEFSERLDQLDFMSRTDLLTRLKEEYTKRKKAQGQNDRLRLTRWSSNFSSSADTSFNDTNDSFNETNGTDTYNISRESEEAEASTDNICLNANMRHREDMHNEEWFEDDTDPPANAGFRGKERLPDLSTVANGLDKTQDDDLSPSEFLKTLPPPSNEKTKTDLTTSQDFTDKTKESHSPRIVDEDIEIFANDPPLPPPLKLSHDDDDDDYDFTVNLPSTSGTEEDGGSKVPLAQTMLRKTNQSPKSISISLNTSSSSDKENTSPAELETPENGIESKTADKPQEVIQKVSAEDDKTSSELVAPTDIISPPLPTGVKRKSLDAPPDTEAKIRKTERAPSPPTIHEVATENGD